MSRRYRCLAVTLVLVAGTSRAEAASTTVACADGAANECLSVSAPLDPSGGLPGETTLHVERLGTIARRKSAIVFVPGGPGEAGAPFLRTIAARFEPAARTRDIVVYDPRGTGKSSGERCPRLPESAIRLDRVVSDCERRLGASSTLYTTAEQVSDLEHIRAELGLEHMLLFGVSFGTRAATAYAARYPEHVEALILDSPVAPHGLDLLRTGTLQALPRVVGESCFGTCQVASDSPGEDLVRLARKIVAKPLRGAIVDATGRPHESEIAVSDLVRIATAVDADASVGAELPSTLWSALHDDPQPLLRLRARINRPLPRPEDGSDLSTSAYLAAVCTETAVPWDASDSLPARRAKLSAAIAAAPLAVLGGFPREALLASPYAETCLHWSGPTRLAELGLPTVPTLVFSGTVDARTSSESARTIAASIPGARLFPVPGARHSVFVSDITGCSRSALLAFLSHKTIRRCSRRGFAFRAFPRVPPVSSGASLRKSNPHAVVAAVAASLDDVTRQIALARPELSFGDFRVRFGGLRGGTVRLANARTHLQRLEVVSGLRLTGVLVARNPTSTLRIDGPSGPLGTVNVSRPGKLIARIGGRRVVGRTRTYGRNPLPTAQR